MPKKKTRPEEEVLTETAEEREHKKLLILALLEITRRHTDVDHPMRYQPLIDALGAEYGLTATRKSVQRNLLTLQGAGYPLHFQHGWYYEHEFSPTELNLLLNTLNCAGGLSDEQRSELRRKICGLGNEHFRPEEQENSGKPNNPEFLHTMEVLQEAIRQGRMVSFHYGNWDVDKQLHPRVDEKGKAKLYHINPYRVLTANGRYYLVCNVDKYNTLTHFRIDRIMDIALLKKLVKPMARVEGAENGIELSEYINNHPYMYSGRPKRWHIRVERSIINDVLDWFGMNVRFEHVTDQCTDVVVRCDEDSLNYWLKRYGDHARLLG